MKCNLVSGLDIFPTICDLAGVEIPAICEREKPETCN